jgi:hypothetical protein
MTSTPIVGAAARLLNEHGPQPVDELAHALGGSGPRPSAGAVETALGGDRRFLRLDDGRWAFLPSLLEGAVLVRRLTAADVEAEAVELDPDLAPLAPLLDGDGLPLAAGGTLRRGSDGDRVTGPAGWLEGATAGTLIGVRLSGGRLEVGTLDEGAIGAQLPARRLVAGATARLAGLEPLFDEPATHVGRLVTELLAELPRLLDAPPGPLGEVLTAGGLEVRGGLVGRRGTDWSLWAAGDDGDATASHPAALDETGREALDLVVGGLALAATGWELEPGHAADLAHALSWPGVAETLAEQVRADPSSAAELEAFLAPIAGTPGAGAAAPLYVLAVCAEARGDGALADDRLAAALAADPGLIPAVKLAARRDEG